MAILPTSSGPHFSDSVHDRLATVHDRQLAAVSLMLSRIFSGRMALSTLYDGPRQERYSAEENADLKDLESALSADTLSLDPLLRDRFGAEPRMLAYLRQIEGHPPQARALLTPEDEEMADEAIAEARAMGYALVPGARMVALQPPSDIEILDKQTGEVRFGAGCGWESLEQAAITAGLSAFTPLGGVFESPLAAARAGIFGPVREIRRFGQPWRLELVLPPLVRSAEEYLFIFPEEEPAALAHQRLTRELVPLFAETFPALDGQALAAAGLAADHKWLSFPNARGLRLILDGPEPIRRISHRLAEKIIRLHGGQRHWKKGLPARAELESLLAACGACRLERPTASSFPTPEDASVTPVLRSIRGRLDHLEVLTYLRDLARSLGEAQQALGLIEDAPRPDAPSLLDGPEETVRAHG